MLSGYLNFRKMHLQKNAFTENTQGAGAGRGGGGAQLVEGLPHTHKALALIPRVGTVVYTCNLGTLQVEAQRLEFQIILSYTSLRLS